MIPRQFAAFGQTIRMDGRIEALYAATSRRFCTISERGALLVPFRTILAGPATAGTTDNGCIFIGADPDIGDALGTGRERGAAW